MSVNTTEIETLYDALEGKAKATVAEQFDAGRLTGSEFAQVLTQTINTAMQISVQTVQNQPQVDAQVALESAQKDKVVSEEAIAEAQSAKDLLVKDKQIESETAKIAEVNAQTTLITDQDSELLLNGTKDRLVKDAQIASEAARALETYTQASLINKQILDVEKAIELKDEEIASSKAKTGIAYTQNLADSVVKSSQASLIKKQELTEVQKTVLTTRQATAYDDNLRIEEGKQLTNVVGMMGAGGTAFSSATDGTGNDVLSTMYTAIDKITP